MNLLYAIGTTIGLPAFGIVLGLCSIHLFEHYCRGNPQGPIYTALTNPKAGIRFVTLVVIGAAGVYSLIVDMWIAVST
jgi:hypothetical protein